MNLRLFLFLPPPSSSSRSTRSATRASPQRSSPCTRALSGGYVNFAVFDLYGDPALSDALDVGLALALAPPSARRPRLPQALQGLLRLRRRARSRPRRRARGPGRRDVRRRHRVARRRVCGLSTCRCLRSAPPRWTTSPRPTSGAAPPPPPPPTRRRQRRPWRRRPRRAQRRRRRRQRRQAGNRAALSSSSSTTSTSSSRPPPPQQQQPRQQRPTSPLLRQLPPPSRRTPLPAPTSSRPARHALRGRAL